MVYPPEDKHIYHFYGSFNAKLGHICYIMRGKCTVTVTMLLKGLF